MIKVSPIHGISDVEAGDLLLVIGRRRDQQVTRVGCIDGEVIFLEPPHENFKWRGTSVGEPFKMKFDSLITNNQVLKINA